MHLIDHRSPFPTYRDALVSPAALGWRQKRQVPLGKAAGEPSRWSTMTNGLGTRNLVDMIAAAASDDPQVLTSPRVPERIRTSEELETGAWSTSRPRWLAEEPAP